MLADNLPTLCWMADADGWIFWFNRKWYEYTGTVPAQMEGWGWQSVHDPAALSDVVERWNAAIATSQPFDMVFSLKGADGIFRPFLTRVEPATNGSGQVTGWFGLNIEITAQLKAENALRKSEQRFRKFSESTCEGVVIHDGKIVLDCNESYARMFGYDTAEDVIGCPTSDFVAPAGFDAVRQRNDGRDEQPYEVCARRKDGSLFSAEFVGREIEWSGQKARVGIARDLTAHRQNEEALRASEERLRSALEISTVGVIFFNVAGEITEANDA